MAIEEFLSLYESGDALDKLDALRLLSKAYILAERQRESIKLFVDTVLSNESLVHFFDAFEIAKAAKALLKSEAVDLDIPICLAVYSRNIDAEFDGALKYSFDRYLELNRIVDPQSLITEERFDDTKFRYFFQHVCTLQNLKISMNFESGRAIEDFRIRICKMLIEHGIGKDSLAGEVKEITRKQVLRDAVKHVDNSRVSADVSSFRDSKSAGFRVAFENYCRLLRNDYSDYEDEIKLAKISDIIDESGIEGSERIMYAVGINLNEKNKAFVNLISMLRDEFAFGDRGLNSFLSTHIRHGFLPNAFRNCVSDERLVTSIDRDTGAPLPNEYWRNIVPITNEDVAEKVNQELSQFTQNIDSIIHEINDSWLQIVTLDPVIKSLKEDAGSQSMIDLSFMNVEAFRLQKNVRIDDYDQFVSVITDWLWKKTELSLKKIQDELKGEAREKFLSSLDSLMAGLVKLRDDNGIDISGLSDAIARSKTSMEGACQKVASWFSRAEAKEVELFDVDMIAEICSKTLGVSYSFSSDNQINFRGKYLSAMEAVLFMIFENVSSKSGVPDGDWKVRISQTINDDSVNFTFQNQCVPLESLEKADSELQRYRNLIAQGPVVSPLTQSEPGGTGFLRMAKILRKIHGESYLDFCYEERDVFRVSFSLPSADGEIWYEDSSGGRSKG